MNEIRKAVLGTVQPPIAPGAFLETDNRELRVQVLALLEEAGARGADIVCLPELLNVFGLSPAEARQQAQPEEVERFLAPMREVAARFDMYVLAPVLNRVGESTYNSVLILDRTGECVGRYDKAHLTDQEKNEFGVTPGETLPVFELDFGRVAMMTCYDCYFPEVARVLRLKGAEVIFYPGWQSGPSEIVMEVQLRARAIDEMVWIVRSSFGFATDTAWKPGMLFGRSCVVDPEGSILADCGHHVGVATVPVDLAKKRLMDVLDGGGDVRDLRSLLDSDRRPELYEAITASRSSKSVKASPALKERR